MAKTTPRLPGRLALFNYLRWQKFCSFLGAGIGGLALFGDLGRDIFANSDYSVRARFITLVVLAGASVGRSYYGYTMAEYSLKKLGLDVSDAPPPGELSRKTDWAWFFYLVAVVLSLGAAAVFVGAAWVAPKMTP